MKRKPHFQHLWNFTNRLVLRMNLRTGQSIWIRDVRGYRGMPSMLDKQFWDESVEKGRSVQITRKQARAFAKSRTLPLVEA